MTNKLALVVAVVLGVLSILGVRFYVEKIKDSYNQKVAPIDVPVATRDLKPGDVVAKGDVTIQQFPHGVVDALGGSHYAANETDKFENAKVVAPIKQGQVYQQYHFRQQRKSNGIPPLGTDWRAITVQVNPPSGLSNMLRPGDKVDIVYTASYEDMQGAASSGSAKKWKITSTLAQKVDVLAIDNLTEAENQSVEYSTVTLKLHPEDINRLTHAIHVSWPYHLVKIDDTAPPTTNLNVVFADTEWDRVDPDVRAFAEKLAKKRINGGK